MATEPLRDSLTALLYSWRQGGSTAFGTLIDQVYDQPRVIAAKRLCRGGSTRFGCAWLKKVLAGDS